MDTDSVFGEIAFWDFFEVYSTSPFDAIMGFIDTISDRDAALQRCVFLETVRNQHSSVSSDPKLLVDDFDPEIELIANHGTIPALSEKLVSFDRLALLAMHPDAIARAYERITGARADWQESARKDVFRATTVPKHLSSGYLVTSSLAGGGPEPKSDAGLSENELYGPSPDRRDFLVSIPPKELGGNCKFGVVIAECVTEQAGKVRRILIVQPSARSGNFVGAMEARDLLKGGRSQFVPGDRLFVYPVANGQDFVALGFDNGDIEKLLASDSRAADPAVSEGLSRLKAEVDRLKQMKESEND